MFSFETFSAQKAYQNRTNVLAMHSGYIINNPQKLTFHRFHYVFHQVRHPLRVISTLVSRCDTWDKYWRWIARMTTFNIITSSQTPLVSKITPFRGDIKQV